MLPPRPPLSRGRRGRVAGARGVTRAFLDACVLFPPLVRALLLGAAGEGLFVPLWSARVLDEWRIAIAARQGLGAEDRARAAQAAMAACFPAALVEAGADEGTRLPDPADAHVLAAAIAGGAGALVTFNLRDFPRRALAAHGIEPRHPDGFLWELWSGAPALMAAVIDAALHDAGVSPGSARAALKRAKLPRFGKAIGERAAGR